MLDKLNNNIKQINIPSIRLFSNKVSKHDNGINLTIGEPDFNTPYLIKKAAINAILNDRTKYSHNAGLLELRISISNFFKNRYNFYYNPKNEIIITTGSSEAIDSVLRTILNPDDEVIIPAPAYSAYEPLINLIGGTLKYLDTSETGFIPEPSKIKKLINKKTKAIIFNNPSNPTGMTIPQNTMDKIVNILREEDVFVISDEIYSENTFNSKHHSFASYPEIREKLFLLHGLSKSHSMTGWRIGYVLGPSILIQEVIKVHLYNSICASLPSQYAAKEALDNHRKVPAEMNKIYLQKRNYTVKRLKQMELDVYIPNGAFYIFPSIKSTNLSSYEFAKYLLEEKQVAVVPGSGFSKYGEGYIRISYATSFDNLKIGLDRMGDFLKNLQQN